MHAWRGARRCPACLFGVHAGTTSPSRCLREARLGSDTVTKISDMQGKKVFIAKKARAKKPKKGEKPAAGEQSGERLPKLGKIHMAVFTPDGRSMVGYLVARPDVAGMVKREDVFVAFDSLAACEKGFRVVGEEGAFDDKARERLGVDWDSCIMWAGMDARTESGRELGYVGDAEFDESTGKVTKFLVGDGGMATALVGSVEIPPSMMVGYSKGRMIVKDEASKLELNGGLAAKAGEATAKAKIRGAEFGEKAGKATGEAVDKGSFALGKALGKAKRAIDDARAEGEAERAREEAEELVALIPTISVEPFHTGRLQELSEHYRSIIGTHSTTDLVEIIKSVYSKKREAEAAGRRVSQMDDRYMKLAEELLHGELSVALEIPKDEVREYIRQRVKAAEAAE